MKKTLLLKTLLGICLFSSLMLGGCSPATTLPSPSIPAPSQTQTIVVEPSRVPATLTPTSTASLTPFPTFTPLPALPEDEALALVFELLETNANCELPCWWGINPGYSNWQESISFFNIFKNVLMRIGGGDVPTSQEFDFFNIFSFPPGLHISISYWSGDQIIDGMYIITEKRKPYNNDFTNDYNNPEYFRIMHNYTLESILTKYGPPDEIWLKSFHIGSPWFPTYTLLYYPDRGILMEYISDNYAVYVDNVEYTETCPTEGFISLRLFNPDAGLSMEELLWFDDNFILYKELQEATGISVSEFSKIFIDPSCDVRLRTPMDLWPEEYNLRP